MNKAIMNARKRVVTVGVSLLMMCAIVLLGGCAEKESPEPGQTEETPKTESTETSPSTKEAAPEATPTITTTGYLQEGSFGDNNVVAFIIKDDGEAVTRLTMQYGNVLVDGNMTQKKNYTIVTAATLDENDLSAFSYAFTGGSIAGSIEGDTLVGVLTIEGVGEFPVNASVAETKTCSSCNGSGSSGSISCSMCTGVGTVVAYKGTYI